MITVMLKKIQTFINTCLKRIFRIKWQDKISNEKLHGEEQDRNQSPSRPYKTSGDGLDTHSGGQHLISLARH